MKDKETGFTKEELKKLDKVANMIYGCNYKELDLEERDEIYCYAEENGYF